MNGEENAGQTALLKASSTSCIWRLFDKCLFLFASFSTAAHGIFWHGHLPGFLCGCVAGLPYSAHQDQTQAKEKPGQSWKYALITTWIEVWKTDSLRKPIDYPTLSPIGHTLTNTSSLHDFAWSCRHWVGPLVCWQKALSEGFMLGAWIRMNIN